MRIRTHEDGFQIDLTEDELNYLAITAKSYVLAGEAMYPDGGQTATEEWADEAYRLVDAILEELHR